MSTTTSSARSARGLRVTLAAITLVAALSAGCGSASRTGTTADASVAGTVEQSLYEKGDTQGVSCENLGTFKVSGVSREIARCSFSEEKSGSGEMRARGGCFAVEDGTVIDVTLEVSADVTCFTKT